MVSLKNSFLAISLGVSLAGSIVSNSNSVCAMEEKICKNNDFELANINKKIIACTKDLSELFKKDYAITMSSHPDKKDLDKVALRSVKMVSYVNFYKIYLYATDKTMRTVDYNKTRKDDFKTSDLAKNILQSLKDEHEAVCKVVEGNNVIEKNIVNTILDNDSILGIVFEKNLQNWVLAINETNSSNKEFFYEMYFFTENETSEKNNSEFKDSKEVITTFKDLLSKVASKNVVDKDYLCKIIPDFDLLEKSCKNVNVSFDGVINSFFDSVVKFKDNPEKKFYLLDIGGGNSGKYIVIKKTIDYTKRFICADEGYYKENLLKTFTDYIKSNHLNVYKEWENLEQRRQYLHYAVYAVGGAVAFFTLVWGTLQIILKCNSDNVVLAKRSAVISNGDGETNSNAVLVPQKQSWGNFFSNNWYKVGSLGTVGSFAAYKLWDNFFNSNSAGELGVYFKYDSDNINPSLDFSQTSKSNDSNSKDLAQKDENKDDKNEKLSGEAKEDSGSSGKNSVDINSESLNGSQSGKSSIEAENLGKGGTTASDDMEDLNESNNHQNENGLAEPENSASV